MGDDWEQLTWSPATDIRRRVADGDVSAVEVTEHFLARVEELDPTLRSFRSLDAAGAREQAARAAASVRRGDELGPLHGVPVSLKESIAVAGLPVAEFLGGVETTAARDDLVVERLRAAGAIVLGTNTMMGTRAQVPRDDDAVAVFAGFDWDAEARNPWSLDRVPGWSSSGGAAATAARLVPVAIGSDGGGSTRLPACWAGVVGVHAPAGLVPQVSYDTPQHSHMMRSYGPMCRDVVDAATTLQVLAGPDGRDFTCQPHDPPDLLGRIDDGVGDLRLAWTDDYGFTDVYAQAESPRVIAAVRAAAQGLGALGADVVDTTETWEDFWPGYLVCSYLYPTGGRPPPPDAADWNDAIDTRDRNWRRFRRLFTEHDLLLSATSQLLAFTFEQWEDAWGAGGPGFAPHGTFAPVWTSHTHLFNWLGFPAVTVPCGFLDGLPVGLQVVGLPGREHTILRAAYAFEQAFPQPARPPVAARP